MCTLVLVLLCVNQLERKKKREVVATERMLNGLHEDTDNLSIDGKIRNQKIMLPTFQPRKFHQGNFTS